MCNFQRFKLYIIVLVLPISKWIRHRYTCVPHPEPSSTSLLTMPFSLFSSPCLEEVGDSKISLHFEWCLFFSFQTGNFEIFVDFLYIKLQSTPLDPSHTYKSLWALRVGHNWATSLSLLCIGGGNCNPLQYSCLENPRDGGAWWAAVSGVAQSRTRLRWLSSSSRRH